MAQIDAKLKFLKIVWLYVVVVLFDLRFSRTASLSNVNLTILIEDAIYVQCF
jgi:hypothetical protein